MVAATTALKSRERSNDGRAMGFSGVGSAIVNRFGLGIE
jgi:hypothetical protein